jgi:CHAT domain-containing protein
VIRSFDELEKTIDEIRHIEGFKGFLTKPSFASIKAVANEKCIVYVLSTSFGGLALIVGDSYKTVLLPELSIDELHDFLTKRIKYNIDTSSKNGTMQTFDKGYLDAYVKMIKHSDLNLWLTALDHTGHWLWEKIFQRIALHLPHNVEVVFIPIGYLALLPLHAACEPHTGSTAGRRYAVDLFNISYAPSAKMLSKEKGTPWFDTTKSILAICNPSMEKKPLYWVQDEVEAAMSNFSDFQILQGENTRQNHVISLLSQYDILHFSCHGSANLENPLRSMLKISKGYYITLEDIIKHHLKKSKFAVLSACETGVCGIKLPEEVISFPMALLHAGLDAVIATLWPVEDFSTMLLISAFYSFWRQNFQKPLHALKSAQQWMRDTTNSEKIATLKKNSTTTLKIIPNFKNLPKATVNKICTHLEKYDSEEHSFAHPYYWAGFVYVGC